MAPDAMGSCDGNANRSFHIVSLNFSKVVIEIGGGQN